MKHFRAAALLAAGVLTASAVGFAACQPQEQHGDRTTVTFYANYISSEVSALYKEMIDTYNQTQGAEDNVWGEQIRCDGRDLDEQPHQHAPMV